MALKEKMERVQEIRRLLGTCPASFIVDYRGLKVAELTQLRGKLREGKAIFRVVKNTLATRSVEEGELEGLGQFFCGPTAVVFVEGDPLISARVLVDFLPDHPNLSIKGGLLDGDFLEEDQVKSLGKMPSREVLLSQMVFFLQLPVARLTGALSSPLRRLMYVLNAISAKKGG